MRRKLLSSGLTTLTMLAAILVALPGNADEVARPKIVALKVFPESLELGNSRDLRRVLVTGVAEDGRTYDLTAESKLQPSGPSIAIDGDGYVVPKTAGEATIAVSAAGLEAKIPARREERGRPAGELCPRRDSGHQQSRLQCGHMPRLSSGQSGLQAFIARLRPVVRLPRPDRRRIGPRASIARIPAKA